MTAWPYDPDTLELVAQRLWQLIPAFYRVQDEPPRGEYELRRFLSVLAAPLALIRQNIEELHADLFIDTCGNEAIGLLADLVATKLLFPDADANRRDVRGTIAWRRRKGTPVMLEEMARELADELVVLHEGWQHIQLAQDLDILRLERVSPDLRPPIVAETSHGPLDRMHHAVDIRAITATTGKYHPRHLVHWRHPSKTWPVPEGTAWKRSESSAGVRFAVHPLGVRSPLLARSTGVDDPLDTDRIPPMHFAARPGDWFDRAGRFTIRVASLPAAIGETEIEERGASELPAEHELAEGQVTLSLLERARDRWTQEVVVALCVVGLVSEVANTGGAVQVRTTLQFDGGGVPNQTAVNTGVVNTTDTVVMIRLTPSSGLGCFFPGATIAITGGRAAARLASQDQALQLRGYLRGALVLELPPTWVFGERWFYLAGDGSLVSAQQDGAGAADVALLVDGGQRTLDLEYLATLGPAAAWPSRRPTTSVDRIVRLPPTPGRGPVVLHGGIVVEDSSSAAVGALVECALEFAAASLDTGVFVYAPMVRLSWTGSDPSEATWAALLDDGTTTPDVDTRFEEIAALRESGASGLRLVVRFVCNEPGARMAPAEVAWSAHDGRTYLLHLPQLDADTMLPTEWLADGYSHTSAIVEPAEDGSTWLHGGGLGRMAEGSIAPLREYACHLRRRLRWRKLCPWDNETSEVLPPTDPGFLDVDVEHGYFAFADDEPPQSWPENPDELAEPPPAVTVDFEDGYSDHVGARPANRELELEARLPAPTRIVSRSGTLSRANDDSLNAVPRYTSLGDALAGIDGSNAVEVVEFQDSATYPDEMIVWPSGISELVIQAAEGHRPVIDVTIHDIIGDPPPIPTYEALTLRGLAWAGESVVTPPSAVLRIEWCSMLDAGDQLTVDVSDDADVRIDHCVCASVQTTGVGTLVVRDSIIDAGKGSLSPALQLSDAELDIERSTVVGEVVAQVLEASEVLFADLVTVTDRFRGCIRYSAVPNNCVLPRRHRVVEGEPPRFVSYDRLHRAHLRLSAETPVEIRFGAEDGGEIGVFHDLQAGKRREALIRRLDEYTPVGLISGLVRVD